MLELKREDWVNVRDTANVLLKNAMMDYAVFKNTIIMAEAQIKKFPETLDDKKNKKLKDAITKGLAAGGEKIGKEILNVGVG